MRSGISGLSNIPSCPHDLANASHIYGTDLGGGVRGKTRIIKPDPIYEETVNVPHNFYQLHYFVTLVADIMFVNLDPFLVTLSKKIDFWTVEHLSNQQAEMLSSFLTKGIKFYDRGGLL